ncbi:MAG: hypothetical protein K8T10_00540 [Candidatus Eremiobacteraeota bacterium]|nr:hypothetical protein [Candidatus Eremiobacteraeota bacterium]
MSIVTVLGRQILINGVIFIVKGVCYAPTPIGSSPETDPPWGDYFTVGYNEIYSRDIPLLRQMNCNTIKTYGWSGDADHTDFLDKCYNNGNSPIYVIVGFWINGGQNLSDPAVRKNINDDFIKMVGNNKDHPAILMWCVGNEMNGSWMYGNDPNWYLLLDELASAAHNEEGENYHPVTTANQDINYIAQRDPGMSYLDLWCATVYRGKTFGTFFSEYESASSKPLVIVEFGIDAWDNNNSKEYDATQAEYAESLWDDITGNSSVCSGGCIFEYADEWWKDKDGKKDEHDFGGYASGAQPDGFSNEEWWGIMRTVKNGNNPDVMEKREIFDAMRDKWD